MRHLTGLALRSGSGLEVTLKNEGGRRRRKGLLEMRNKDYNCAAAWTLVGSFCGSSGKVKNPLMGAVPNQAKVLSRKIPLASTTKQHPLQGFFTSIAAVLHTIASAQVGGVELTDERNHVSAGRGRSVISQDAQDVGVKGLNHSATVSSARAVADADSFEPTMKLHAGTANRTVSRIGFNPYPCIRLVIARINGELQ